jgi:hypothetical protein
MSSKRGSTRASSVEMISPESMTSRQGVSARPTTGTSNPSRPRKSARSSSMTVTDDIGTPKMARAMRVMRSSRGLRSESMTPRLSTARWRLASRVDSCIVAPLSLRTL